MYNNFSQTPPYYTYGYGIPQQYQRPVVQQESQNTTQPVAPAATMPMMQLNYIKGRPVVSIDEARASQIDLDGSLYVFPDLGNKKIYTKQINMDGTATFNVFELAAPAEEAATPIYVTRDELDAALEQLKASLTAASAPKPKVAANFNL